MTFGLSRIHWYDLIMVGLAMVIVYPDWVLIWVGQARRRPFERWHIILFEPVTIGVMIVAMRLLSRIFPGMDWMEILVYVGAIGLVRFIYWFGGAVIRGLFDI
jgi:hypothetical protein